jgi:hypothetical protein
MKTICAALVIAGIGAMAVIGTRARTGAADHAAQPIPAADVVPLPGPAEPTPVTVSRIAFPLTAHLAVNQVPAAAPVAPVAPAAPPPIPVVTAITSGSLVYKPPFFLSPARLVSPTDLTVNISEYDTTGLAAMTLVENATPYPVTQAVGGKITAVTLKGALTPGLHTLVLRMTDPAQRTGDSTPFQVLVPDRVEDITVPQVVRASNGRNVAAVPLSQFPNGIVPVFGRYLRLEGSGVLPGTSLVFALFSATNEADPRPVAATWTPPDLTGGWTATLTLPVGLENTSGKLYVWATRNGRTSAPSAPVPIQVRPLDQLPRLVINAVTRTLDKTVVTPHGSIYYLNTRDVTVTVGPVLPPGVTANPLSTIDGQVLIYANDSRTPAGELVISPADRLDKSALQVPVNLPAEGLATLTAALAQDDSEGPRSAPLTVNLSTQGPRVLGVQPLNFATTPGAYALTIQFDRDHPLDPNTAVLAANYFLTPGQAPPGQAAPIPPKERGTYDPTTNSVTITFDALRPDVYVLTVKGDAVTDVFGNFLQGTAGHNKTDFTLTVLNPVGGQLPSESRGITGQTGPNVEFKEYLDPRNPSNDFNPSDHVETRVARLYYFRDANRVAQIVNRDVKSYNYVAVSVQRRLAVMARDVANQLTDKRRAQEQRAVEASQAARLALAELQRAQQTAASAQREQVAAQQQAQMIQQQIDALKPDDPRLPDLRNSLATLQAVASSVSVTGRNAAGQIEAAAAKVQTLRQIEIQESEAVTALTAQEDRAKQEAFQREVAAMYEDPDTYAPAKPESDDPVRRCSISVIGVGEIQLRGPIKGLNIIRTMINQIDAPVGQVRITVHTAQVNGEHEDRMERVANRIQRYIDHSRFLTSQSAQMLRNAIVTVAARKAEEVAAACPPGSQAARDEKYLYAFFGKDFIQELEALDSEFLHTGNKLLSLHSMDSTSLASALFLLALAKNGTRREILDVFENMIAVELPDAEMSFFEEGGPDQDCNKVPHKDCNKFPLLAANARFRSLRGFFDAEVAGDETMTPIQREFVKLAQIFKSRLVTELEYNQRVTERAIIEERFVGNYQEEVMRAYAKEQTARQLFADSQRTFQDQRTRLVTSFGTIRGELDLVLNDLGKVSDEASSISVNLTQELPQRLVNAVRERYGPAAPAPTPLEIDQIIADAVNKLDTPEGSQYSVTSRLWEEYKNKGIPEVLFHVKLDEKNEVEMTLKKGKVSLTPQELAKCASWIRARLDQADKLRVEFYSFDFTKAPAGQRAIDQVDRLLKRVKTSREGDELDNLLCLLVVYQTYNGLANAIRTTGEDVKTKFSLLLADLTLSDQGIRDAHRRWLAISKFILDYVDGPLEDRARPLLDEADRGFTALLEQIGKVNLARRAAEESRRPLDHKKLLDMLIDDVEDKYIDLLEGTRAHTANIDNYIKSVATALDDDFQTQFYLPAFRGVREASSYWDVQLGKVESTSILTNNRAFAKVEPEATMEFDLPKRDILIAEAMNSSLAMMQTYGALLQDPTFLALTKLNSGQPTSSPVPGAAGGLSIVRNVLPALPSDSEERVLSQNGPGQLRLATPLEALIPDPAIYKFETGTGYQIRPVLSPDGQSVVFHFSYMYTTDVREPVRADEKHLGRVKRHFIDTDVQLGNYELREISRYQVALKASRTSRGVPLLEDIPGVGALFRPLPSAESSLQENIVLGQAVIFPTLFDLMGLRWAPAVADLDPLRTRNQEFVVRGRLRDLKNHTYDYSASRVDEFLRIPPAERRPDLYRSQETIPYVHPDGYSGPGLNLRDSHLQEGYDPVRLHPDTRFVPSESPEGVPGQPGHPYMVPVPGAAIIEHPVYGPPPGYRPDMLPPAAPPGYRPDMLPPVAPPVAPPVPPAIPPSVPAPPAAGWRPQLQPVPLRKPADAVPGLPAGASPPTAPPWPTPRGGAVDGPVLPPLGDPGR